MPFLVFGRPLLYYAVLNSMDHPILIIDNDTSQRIDLVTHLHQRINRPIVDVSNTDEAQCIIESIGLSMIIFNLTQSSERELEFLLTTRLRLKSVPIYTYTQVSKDIVRQLNPSQFKMVSLGFDSLNNSSSLISSSKATIH